MKENKIIMWIDVQGTDENMLKTLENIFNLHPLTTEDITNHSTGMYPRNTPY